ncbi:MAG: metallophosphoesterase [Verrucomicrobiae bacterium]|nr:metallophosphoesterase [Verrucomicrobiae bacterium]
MRLHILSDLHLEFGGGIQIPPTDADVVVLAGDIHLGCEGSHWAKKQFPSQPVIYVPGNHEYYRHSLPALTELLQHETEGSHLCVLENKSVEIGGYTFLGCTLWTDFLLNGNPAAAMRLAAEGMSDYHVIRFNPQHRQLSPQDTVRLHHESVSWLRRELAQHEPARTIVITHHAPSARSEPPDHASSPLRPAFSSCLDPLIEPSGVPLWIFGHTHHNVDFTVGTTRLLTNQRGYPHQLCAGFNAGLVVEI